MSLLDDVSIVVTPNGYKAGELYSVIPVPSEGSELLTNEDFSNGLTGWGTQIPSGQTVEVISNQLHIDYDSTGTQGSTGVYQSILTSGNRYTTTIDVASVTGTFKVQVGSVSHAITTSGIKTFTNVASSNTIYVVRQSNSTSFEATINSVSVKEYTSADMDVTRATAATRVDENGLVNYAEVLGSEEIDCGNFECATPSTYWTEVGNSSLVVGDYQGRTNVANINILGTANSDRIKQDFDYVSGVTYFISLDVYLVSGNFRCDTSNSVVPYDFVATNITGSWQTLTGYFTATSTGTNGLWLRSSQQINQFYVSNISVKEVTRDNVPRIDYTGGGCPHILAEPMRTNLVPYSEDFSQYTNSDTTDTANTVTSPDGTVNGTTLTASGSGSLNHIITSPTYTIASGEITSSIFAKKGTVNYIRLRLNGTTGGERAWYNLNNGTIDGEDVSSSAKIEDYGNGWYRCSLTSSSNIASGSGKSLQIFIQDSGGSQTAWTANGTENIYIWGTQTEQGYGTSYIPNFGTALGVTRNQDIFTRDGIGSLINSTEGVLFVEIAAFADYTTYRYMGLTDGGSDNRVIILYYNSSTRIRVLLSSGGTKYFDAYYAVTSIEDFHKVALKWKENDFALWIDGVERATDTSGLAPIGLNTVALDQAGGDNFYGKVKQLQVYDTALTDEQLEALTT